MTEVLIGSVSTVAVSPEAETVARGAVKEERGAEVEVGTS